MTAGTVAIPAEPTTAEDLAPGALSAYAAEMVPIHRRRAGLPDRQEWVTLAGIANTLAASEMIPKGLAGRANNVLAVILKGRDLGLSPTESVWGIDMIEGMPTLKSHTMSALIKRAGHRLWYDETSSERATIKAQRLERWAGNGEPVYGPEITLTWTIEDAIAAKLVTRLADGRLNAMSSSNKPKPWMLYPAAMLRARALTAIARMEFSDVLMGAWYSPEELGAEVDADGKVTRLPQGNEAVVAFESVMERRPEHTGPSEPEAQSRQPSPQVVREGEELSGMLTPDAPTVIDVEAEPPAPPPTRDELWAELVEQARVLADGSLARHAARATAAYKANPEQWTDEQLAEFVAGRRDSYWRHLEAHPDLVPAPVDPGVEADRNPYVEDEPDPVAAALRSAQMDREELDTLPTPSQPGYEAAADRRAYLEDSARRWEEQAERARQAQPADEPAPAGTEPEDDPAPDGTEPADTPSDTVEVEDPPEGYDESGTLL